MIKNYLKIAWRSMASNRAYSVTNLVGLTIGLTVVLCIATLVMDDLSYDKQWTLSEELYTINSVNTDQDGNVLYRGPGAIGGLGNALQQEFPEILGHTTLSTETLHLMLDQQANRSIKLTTLNTDTNFFNLFDTQRLVGNPKQVVSGAKNLVITESLHKAYFNGANIIGETFYNRPANGTPQAYVVTAIIRDLPQNTHLRAQAIQLSATAPQALSPYGAGYVTKQYVRIRREINIEALTSKTNDWYLNYLTQEGDYRMGFEFQAIKDVYLHSAFGSSKALKDVYVLGGIGLLILILACINFINLSFAHAIKRTLEMGVRKTFGARRFQLILQGITESLVFFGFSLAMAFFLYLLVIPGFETYLGYSLTQVFHRSFPLALLLLVGWLGLGLLCGLAPALSLAKTKTSYALKKRMEILRIPLKTGLTKSLLVLQFSIAMVVIIGMLTVQQQLRYMLNKDLGYDSANLLILDYMSWEGKGAAFKQSLLQQPGITAVSLSQWAPMSGSYQTLRLSTPDNPNEKVETSFIESDFDLLKTIGFKLIDGRTLHPSFAKDDLSNIEGWDEGYRIGFPNALYTETAARRLGASLNQADENGYNVPVGILQDFHFLSLRNPIEAVIIQGRHELNYASMLVRVAKGKERETLAAVEATWNQAFPGRLPRINWADEELANQYKGEQQQFHQLLFFSGISMLLAILGVFGIVVYTVERKVREIGIRKVLGASVYSIMALLSTNFFKLVCLAAVIAFPIAWWVMNGWLENFAYRIEIPWWLFALTGLLALCSMFIVVGLRTFKAATANPVDSLRDE
ncbi:ABC transporter permease [Parapedobacter sp. DT-150]|uniref:ABC transporter permease n=1 Tax=Parapedobacter sp. DT-150 TaxID=3396162 RepID=UPI003F1AF62B